MFKTGFVQPMALVTEPSSNLRRTKGQCNALLASILLASIHRITGLLEQCKALKLYYLSLDHPSHSPFLLKFIISIVLLSLTQNISYIL
jgi:hypothetical protein